MFIWREESYITPADGMVVFYISQITSRSVIICLMNSAQPPKLKLNSSIINYKIAHYFVVSGWCVRAFSRKHVGGRMCVRVIRKWLPYPRYGVWFFIRIAHTHTHDELMCWLVTFERWQPNHLFLGRVTQAEHEKRDDRNISGYYSFEIIIIIICV